jgi:hypothetical protein
MVSRPDKGWGAITVIPGGGGGGGKKLAMAHGGQVPETNCFWNGSGPEFASNSGMTGFWTGGQPDEGSVYGSKGGAVRDYNPKQIINMLKGGQVPGKAKVSGDSPKNDTVSAKLSPGECVIPRSVMMHADAPKHAADYVAWIKRINQENNGK